MSVDTIRDRVAELGSGPVMVHADAFGARRLIAPDLACAAALDAHVAALRAIAEDRGLWLAAMDDVFPAQQFDVRRTPCAVGRISEHYRLHHAQWRTPVPLASFAGEGPAPALDLTWPHDPYGEESIFAELAERDGVLLFYGAPFSSATILHYAEIRAGRPPYRYDKLLEGRLITADDRSREAGLLYHCRPRGMRLDYDFPRLQLDLETAGLLWRLPRPGVPVMAVNAARLRRFWDGHLARDPLYLLDRESRDWVAPLLSRLGRRFVPGDFET